MEKTKEELRSYRNDLKHLEKLQEQIEELKEEAEKTTKELSDMPRSGGGAKDKIAECVALMVDLQKEKAEKTIPLLLKLKKIENTIERLPTYYGNILHDIYIDGKTLTEVSAENKKDYIYFCRTIHKKALELYKEEREKQV